MIVDGKYYGIDDIKRNADLTQLASSCGWVYQKRKGKEVVYVRGSGKAEESIRIAGPERSPKGFWTFIHEQHGLRGNCFHLVAYSNFGYGINSKNDDKLPEIMAYIVKELGLNGDSIKKKQPVIVPAVIEKDEKVLPFEPAFEFPYLEFRGITADTYNSPSFSGLLGTRVDFPHEVTRKGETVVLPSEAINYRPDDAMFPPTVAVFKNINGEIINKEFVNRYKPQVMEDAKGKKKTASIRQYYEGGVRGSSLFQSNVPAGMKVDKLFIGEAWLDVMSYYQLHAKADESIRNNTLFTAHGGQITQGQVRILNHLIKKHDVQRVLLSNDFDKSGLVYNLTLLGSLSKKDLPFTFEAKGNKSRPGISVFFIGISEKDYKDITGALKEANLTGGVELDASARSFSFFFTRDNYRKVGATLVKYRSPEHTGIDLSTVFPKGYKDWNDQVMGKEASVVQLEEDHVPLVSYLERVHNLNIKDSALSMDRLRLEQTFSASYNPLVNVYDAPKNWLVGRFNLDTLTYEADPRYRAYHENEDVKADLAKITSYFSPEPMTAQEIEAAILNGIKLDGNIILNQGSERIGEVINGRIDLDSNVSLSDAEYDSLDVVQSNLNLGLPWNTVLEAHGTTLTFNKVEVLQFRADSTLNDLGRFPDYAQAVALQAEVIQKLRPPRYIPSAIEGISIQLKGENLWYGSHELGLYNKDSKVFSLYPAMSEVVLPDAFYKDLDKIRNVGYEEYLFDLNNPKTFQVSLQDQQLTRNDQRIGTVGENGVIYLDRDSLEYSTLNAMERLHIPASQVKVLDKTGEVHRFAYTRDLDFAISQDRAKMVMNGETKTLFIGDTPVGKLNPQTNEVDLLPHIPKSQSLEEAASLFRKDQDVNLPKSSTEDAVTKGSGTITVVTNSDYDSGIAESLTVDLSAYSNTVDFIAHLEQYARSRGQVVDDNHALGEVIKITSVSGFDPGDKPLSVHELFSEFQKQNNILNEMQINPSAENPLVQGSGFFPGDPKFLGRLSEGPDRVELVASIPGQRQLVGSVVGVDEDVQTPGYFSTNHGSVLPDEYRIFPTRAALLDHYRDHRDDLVLNDRVALIAPLNEQHFNMAVLQAALCAPKHLAVFGEDTFTSAVKEVASKYIKEVTVNPNLENTSAPALSVGRDNVEVLRGMVSFHEDINVVEDRNSGDFYFPHININRDGHQARLGVYTGRSGDLWVGTTASRDVFTATRIPSIVLSTSPVKSVLSSADKDPETPTLVAAAVPGEGGFTRNQMNSIEYFIQRYKVEFVRLLPDHGLNEPALENLKELGLKVTVEEEKPRGIGQGADYHQLRGTQPDRSNQPGLNL